MLFRSIKKVDQAVASHILHKNNAAHKKSALMKKLAASANYSKSGKDSTAFSAVLFLFLLTGPGFWYMMYIEKLNFGRDSVEGKIFIHAFADFTILHLYPGALRNSRLLYLSLRQ